MKNEKHFLLKKFNCSNGETDVIGITTDEDIAKKTKSVFCSYEEVFYVELDENGEIVTLK